MAKNGWIGVDFDGTIATYNGWKGELEFGQPIPLMVERVKKWLAQGFEVRIVTARVGAFPVFNSDGTLRDVQSVRAGIETWCEKHIGKKLYVTNCKDFDMIELWDDRAIQVIGNTAEIATNQKVRYP